jgi:hypothetical protein
VTGHWTAALAFALVAAGMLVIDLRARRPGSRLVTFTVLAGRLMASRSGRIGVLVVWWWLGWHFLAR